MSSGRWSRGPTWPMCSRSSAGSMRPSGRAAAAVRIAEMAGHLFTLHFGLFDLGLAHLRRGDLPHATQVLERCLDLCRAWQFADRTPLVAAALGAAYALVGRSEEALPLVADAVQEFRHRQSHE